MAIKSILVSGASGLLGLNVALEACKHYKVFGIVHEHPLKTDSFQTIQTDLMADGSAKDVIDQTKPDAVIHCAALANLDACEADLSMAWSLNADVPGAFAEAAKRAGIPFLHISTDAVFDGRRGQYSETDVPYPTNNYARTKYLGEMKVSQAYPAAVIARVNLFGWSMSGKRSLAEFFFNNLQAGQTVQGFTDVFFCPLLVNDLAQILMEMLERRLEGLYHVFSPECISKYDFGMRIARRFGFDEKLVKPCSVEEGGLKASRSPNLTMNSKKITQVLGRPLPDVDKGITGFYELFKEGYPVRLRQMSG